MVSKTHQKRAKQKKERERKADISKKFTESHTKKKVGGLSGRDRLELAQSRSGAGQEYKMKDGEIVSTTSEERRQKEITATAQKGIDSEKEKYRLQDVAKEERKKAQETQGTDIMGMNLDDGSGITEGGLEAMPQEMMGQGGVSSVEAGDILALSGVGGAVKGVAGAIAAKFAAKQAMKKAEEQIIKMVMESTESRTVGVFQEGVRILRTMKGTGGIPETSTAMGKMADIRMTQKIVTKDSETFLSPFKTIKKVSEVGISPMAATLPKAIPSVATNVKTMGLTLKILLGAGATMSAIGGIMTIYGTYPFTGFIKEEAIQTAGFPIKSAMDVGLYDEAEERIEDIISLVNANRTLIDKIPLRNTQVELMSFNEEAVKSAILWQKIIDEHRKIEEGERETQFDIERKAYGRN